MEAKTLFLWIGKIVESARPDLKRLKITEVINTFKEATSIEMDLRLEGAAAEELKGNFQSESYYFVPSIDWRRTTKRVLTQDRVTGIPIDEKDRLIKEGFKLEDILSNAALALFKQVFQDGFFHADQHPGNLFVGENSEIKVVDFGIMGRLDKSTRHYLGIMLLSFLNRDYPRVAEAHFDAGYVKSNKSLEAFAQACRSIAEPILDRPQNEISIARLLAHLFQVTKTFEMETQPQLLLLQKTMLVAEGVGRNLCPELNFWALTQPLIEKWIGQTLTPDAIITQKFEDAATSLRKLPQTLSKLERFTLEFADHGIKLHPNTIKEMETTSKPSTSRLNIFFLVTILLLLFLVLS